MHRSLRMMASNAKSVANLKPIKLYTAATMNGYKASIILEELGLPYEVKYMNFSKNEQKEAWYLKINPNGRIPAIIDPNNDDFTLAESAAILMYLCEQYDPENKTKLYPFNDMKLRYQIVQWLYFQMSAIGPIMGNSMYFYRIARAKGINDEFAEQRFKNESIRLLSVLDKQLESQFESSNDKKEFYIVGSFCTIADIACYPYVKSAFWANIELKDFKYIQQWIETMDKRPAVIKGLTIPKENRKFFGEGNEKEIEQAIKENAAKFKIPNQSENKQDT